jgi:hypothetical protein
MSGKIIIATSSIWILPCPFQWILYSGTVCSDLPVHPPLAVFECTPTALPAAATKCSARAFAIWIWRLPLLWLWQSLTRIHCFGCDGTLHGSTTLWQSLTRIQCSVSNRALHGFTALAVTEPYTDPVLWQWQSLTRIKCSGTDRALHGSTALSVTEPYTDPVLWQWQSLTQIKCSGNDRALHGSSALAVTEPYTDLFFKRAARWVRGFLICVRPTLQISVLAIHFSGWLTSVYIILIKLCLSG